MKIISQFKDYYDHLVSTYGYDETRILDRRNEYHGAAIVDGTRNIICIAGNRYPVIYKKGSFFFKESPELDRYDNKILRLEKYGPDLNAKYRMPVVYQHYFWATNKFLPIVPILREWGFPSILSPEKVYSEIYDYLGWLKDNPAPPDNQTDKEKIVSHGFDKKTSFRPKMKK